MSSWNGHISWKFSVYIHAPKRMNPFHFGQFLSSCVRQKYQRKCNNTDMNPSCLQTTAALISFQPSSHTLPHWPLMKTSTLPSFLLSPATKRTRGPADENNRKKRVIIVLLMILISALRFSDAGKFWHILRYACLYKDNKYKSYKQEKELSAFFSP